MPIVTNVKISRLRPKPHTLLATAPDGQYNTANQKSQLVVINPVTAPGKHFPGDASLYAITANCMNPEQFTLAEHSDGHFVFLSPVRDGEEPLDDEAS